MPIADMSSIRKSEKQPLTSTTTLRTSTNAPGSIEKLEAMVDQDGIDAVTRCKMQDMINELTVEQDRKDKEIKAMKEQIEKAERKGIHAEEMLASTRPTRIICIAYLILGLIFLWSYRNEGRLNRANSKMIAWEYRTQKQKVFERTFDQKERHFEAELNKRSFGQKQGL